MRLFSAFVLRRIAQQPLRSATTAFGIALGVAVVVAIQLANASAINGFRTAIDTVAGRTALEIVGPGTGLDETLVPGLDWVRRYAAIAPVVEGQLVWRPDGGPAETLHVLGVDILRDRSLREYQLVEWAGGRRQPTTQQFLELLLDPTSAILTAKFAAAHALVVGSTLTVASGDRLVSLRVRGLLADEGPARVLDGRLVLMDIAAAQLALGRLGRIDRLDLAVPDGASIDAAEAAIAERLPPGLRVRRPVARGREAEQMLAAFHLNLTALSYIALIVGLYLVYNTVSAAVIARRAEIGTLRALGTTRGQIRRLFLAEAALLAAVGGVAGLALGRVAANWAVAVTSTTVSTMYIATAAAPPALEPRHVLLAFLTSVPLSLIAAFVPAREASRVPPVAAIRGVDREGRPPAARPRQAWAGVLLLALGAWLGTLGPIGHLPIWGYASVVAIIAGASCLVPFALAASARVLDRVARRGPVEGWLAVNTIATSVPRLSISVGALAVSLAMMVAIAVMIGSFRETVAYWVSETLQADLFVAPGAGQKPAADETISAGLVSLITASPDVDAVDRFRIADVAYGDGLVRVRASDFAVLLSRGHLLFKSPRGGPATTGVPGPADVLVSESFALKHGVGVGDTIALPSASGPARLTVAAVYYDYSSDRGVVTMDHRTYATLYGEQDVSGLAVYLKPGVDPEAARARLLAGLDDPRRVTINTQPWLRAEVLRIFDSTFAITYALELVAIVVAMLGVAGTLLTLMLERRRELTMLRLLGTTRRQLARMLVAEAAIIGAIGQAIGLVIGLALSLVLIYVINVQSFGWTIQFHLPAAFLAQSSVLVVVATGVAGLYPARLARRLELAGGE